MAVTKQEGLRLQVANARPEHRSSPAYGLQEIRLAVVSTVPRGIVQM